MWHAEFRLYLYPSDPEVVISVDKIEGALRQLEFIDQSIEGEVDQRFSVGEEFLSLICFMGCSPNIEIEPKEDSPFCYIEVPKDNALQFIAGENAKKVNCPHCKTPQPQLVQTLLTKGEDDLLTQCCSECGEVINPAKLNWRKSAFMARSWVLLGNIYESEAIPDEKLLNALQQLSGCEWKYAYVRKR